MKNFDWKKLLPHAIAIAIFLVVTAIYCKPALEGKVLQQADVTQWKAMARDQVKVQELTGKVPNWTNGMFSGMPGYLIIGNNNNTLPFHFTNILSLYLPKPLNFFFLACVCFYFLSQVVRVRSWIGTFAALCYAFATYNAIIIAEGHDTKMLTIAVLPGFIAGLSLLYQKQYAWGVALTALFSSALIAMNHYQIAYYGFIIALFMSVGYAVQWIQQKDFKHLLVAAGLAITGVTFGVLSNAVVIYTNYEYSKATIRGGSELAKQANAKTAGKGGLSEDYALSYSIYKSEPFVLMVPKMFGGSSSKPEIEETTSKAMEALQNMPQQIAQQLGYPVGYWGGIGGTSGPPYAGAIVCFLALLGFGVLDNKHKWWILACTVFAILLSWGSYFKEFNVFMLNNLPMYNKFRAPSMILVIPTFLVGLQAMLTLDKVLYGFNQENERWDHIKKGLYINGAAVAILLFLYVSFDYLGEREIAITSQLADIKDASVTDAVRSYINGVAADRKTLFLSSLLRSIFFMIATLAAIWAFHKNMLKATLTSIIIGLLAFIDVVSVDTKYLSSENYQIKEDNEATFTPNAADNQILQDKGYYRVFDVTQGPQAAINYGARTSYFHRSIGGYHPAKLSIYQDLAEKHLYNFPNCMPVLNMLNTKYIIFGQDPNNPQVSVNPNALGAAWFVKGIRKVPNALAEIDALSNLTVKDTAVVQSDLEAPISNNFSFDSSATITLEKNENDVITYTSNAATPQLAVFSEIYYKDGWNVYVDDQPATYTKVNYVLRSMIVPAGKHTIVWKFEPKSKTLGASITTAASIVILLLLALAALVTFRSKKS